MIFMELVGMCHVCGVKPGTNTCRICGKLACSEHFDSRLGICVSCKRGRTIKK